MPHPLLPGAEKCYPLWRCQLRRVDEGVRVEKKIEGEKNREGEKSENLCKVPFPKALVKKNLEKQFSKFVDMFRKLHVELEGVKNTKHNKGGGGGLKWVFT